MLFSYARNPVMREKMIAIIVFLSLILITPVTATAEIKFDVKTKLHERRQLRLIKLAVVQLINESNWAKVKEFGEDYSLWLKNIKRRLNGELIVLELDVEIHGPAMITEGAFIDRRHLTMTYNPSAAEKVNPDKADSLNTMVHEQLNSAGLLGALVPLFLPVAGPI